MSKASLDCQKDYFSLVTSYLPTSFALCLHSKFYFPSHLFCFIAFNTFLCRNFKCTWTKDIVLMLNFDIKLFHRNYYIICDLSGFTGKANKRLSSMADERESKKTLNRFSSSPQNCNVFISVVRLLFTQTIYLTF